MSLRSVGISAVSKALANSRFDAEGAYRRVVFFELGSLKYVIKVDRGSDEYDDEYDEYGDEYDPEEEFNQCDAEAMLWSRYKDTDHCNLLCPVLDHGKFDHGLGWLIMPRLQSVFEISDDNEAMVIFKEHTVANIKARYPRAISDTYRIYLPNNLFGDDLHWSNWGYDSKSKLWKIIDYAGDAAKESYDD